MKFEYHVPEINDGKIVLRPPFSVDLQGRKAWDNFLVGHFFEMRVAFYTIYHHATRKWKNKALHEVIMNDEGFFSLNLNVSRTC